MSERATPQQYASALDLFPDGRAVMDDLTATFGTERGAGRLRDGDDD